MITAEARVMQEALQSLHNGAKHTKNVHIHKPSKKWNNITNYCYITLWNVWMRLVQVM